MDPHSLPRVGLNKLGLTSISMNLSKKVKVNQLNYLVDLSEILLLDKLHPKARREYH